jgi:hypothetical protein
MAREINEWRETMKRKSQRLLVVMLVFAPTLQASAALAASTPRVGSSLGLHGQDSATLSLGKTDASHMALSAHEAGVSSAKNASAFGGATGQSAINGHTGSFRKLAPSFVQTLRKTTGALPGASRVQHVVQIGVIHVVGASTLELSRPSVDSLTSGSRILYSTAVENFLSRVSVPQLAWLQLRNPQRHLALQRATSLDRLHAGMLVLVAGDDVAGTLRARVISTVAGATVHHISPGKVSLGRQGAGPRSGVEADTGADFGGTFAGPTYSYARDFNNTLIFTIGIVQIRLQLVTFAVGLGGAAYRWPFTFSATPGGPLVVGQPTTVNLQVTPQSRSDGGYTLNFTAGVDAGVGLYIYIAIGCGPTGLSSCRFSPKPHVGVGFSLSTRSPAPMPGQTVRLSQDTCPSIPIFAIPVVSWGLVLRVCFAMTLKGAPFLASMSATGANMPFAQFSFDGKTPHSVTLTPTASQVNLRFGSLDYAGAWDVGIEPMLALNPFGVRFSFGTLTLVRDVPRQWIGSPTNQRIQLIFPSNQPDSIVIPFAAASRSDRPDTSPIKATLVR